MRCVQQMIALLRGHCVHTRSAGSSKTGTTAHVAHTSAQDVRAGLRKIFRLADRNNDGVLDVMEFVPRFRKVTRMTVKESQVPPK